MEQNPFGKVLKRHNQWSSLPDDILHKILSYLDLLRKFDITISATTFDIKQSERYIFCINEIYDLWNILNTIFTIFTSPSIETFRLHLPWIYYLYSSDYCACPIIESWASQLGGYNVRNFNVTSHGGNSFGAWGSVYAPSIFQMHSLVSLNLDLSIFRPDNSVPHSINFPNMKNLLLVLDNYECLERIISSCLSLEDLSFTVKGVYSHNKINYLLEDGSISVFSKSLKRLCISLLYKSGNLEVIIDAANLVHLNFAAPYLSMPSDMYMGMFDSISHVKSLSLNIKAWTRLDDSPTMTTFPNATQLTWVSSSSHKYEDMVLMLHSCPNLEVFVLEQKNNGNYWQSLIAEDIFMPLEHVKQIELRTNVIPLDQQFLSLGTCLLRSAPLLQKLILNAIIACGAKAEFFQPLSKCPRRSPQCQIEFLGAYESIFVKNSY